MTVSVAVALYNGERFIKQQLDTVRLQTVKPNEVILCDDCSSDGTVSAVAEYIKKHSLEDSWKLYKNEYNLGYAKNFYRAMELCTGDLIYLCDQDDIWNSQKIEKMNKVMEENPDISLLMCKGGVVDAEGNDLQGLLIKKADQTGAVKQVTVEEIFQVFDWTGMLMCVRKDFFKEKKDAISEIPAPHDFVLALSSADRGEFYTFDYVGAYHRRHENNAANEEHRISKVLNLKRKLRDIDNYNQYLEGILGSKIGIKEDTAKKLIIRLEKSQQRKKALEAKSLKQVLKLYFSDKYRTLRLVSFVCDVWLVLFGGKI